MRIYKMIRQSMLLPSMHGASSPVGHRLRRDSVADEKRPAGSRTYGYRICLLNFIIHRLIAQVHSSGLTQPRRVGEKCGYEPHLRLPNRFVNHHEPTFAFSLDFNRRRRAPYLKFTREYPMRRCRPSPTPQSSPADAAARLGRTIPHAVWRRLEVRARVR